MKWIISYLITIHYLSSTSSPTHAYEDTKCTGDMLQLSCHLDHLIVVQRIYFGKSRTCTHGPWPPGCVQENHHFHPCTGLRLCAVKAPSIEIKGCGFNDYVHVEYDCIEASTIEDICTADRKKNILRSNHGYIATSGYPTKLTMPRDIKTCIARLFITKPINSVINVYILDSFSSNGMSDEKQCNTQVKLTESVLKRRTENGQRSTLVPVKGKAVCLEGMFHRNDLLYSSENGHLLIQFAVSGDERDGLQRKGMLLYYEVETKDIVALGPSQTSQKTTTSTTTMSQIEISEKQDDHTKQTLSLKSTTEPVRDLAATKIPKIETTTLRNRIHIDRATKMPSTLDDKPTRITTTQNDQINFDPQTTKAPKITTTTKKERKHEKVITTKTPRLQNIHINNKINSEFISAEKISNIDSLSIEDDEQESIEQIIAELEQSLATFDVDTINDQIQESEESVLTDELINELVTVKATEMVEAFFKEPEGELVPDPPIVQAEETTTKTSVNVTLVRSNKVHIYKHKDPYVTKRVTIPVTGSQATTNSYDGNHGDIDVDKMKESNETVDIILEEMTYVNSTKIETRKRLGTGLKIGGALSILPAVAVIAFLIYYFYRRHQRKVTFYRNRLRYRPRVQHKIFTTDTFPTEIAPKVSNYENPAFSYETTKAHLQEQENPYEVPISTAQESSLKLSQNEEISIGNDFLQERKAAKRSNSITAVCEPYATSVIENKMVAENTVNENNQNHNLKKQRSSHNGQKTVIYANGVRVTPQKKAENKAQIKFSNPVDTKDTHINDWVKHQVKHTYLTTIKEELQNHELINKNGSKSNTTRNNGSFKHELEAKVKDYLEPPDSRFLSDNANKCSIPVELQNNTEVHEADDLNSSTATEIDDTTSDGPNNLKRFHIRKSSKRKFTNLQYAQLDHIRGRGLSLPPKSPDNIKPETQVVYSSIDFKKSIELHEKAIEKHKKNKMLLSANENLENIGDSSEPMKTENTNGSHQSEDDQDWTIQIQLSMSNVPKGSAPQGKPNNGERSTNSTRRNSYSEKGQSSTGLSTFSKPDPKPKPRMAVAPKPILKKGNQHFYMCDTDLSHF